jgi:hypothetical protein
LPFQEKKMPVATIDGLKVNYLVQGSGPHLLMLAPHQNAANVLAAIMDFAGRNG